ncbi:hypothetical protein KFY57_28300, partial [Salmonella enterica subsp. enterica serovar Typhimurium]|nr:hypothetical protein [Salmonella enterica subsp. enterica serovar Typhimurium]
MMTYFLVQNLYATEDDIMGRPPMGNGGDPNKCNDGSKWKSEQCKQNEQDNNEDQDHKPVLTMKYADSEQTPIGNPSDTETKGSKHNKCPENTVT